MESSSPLPRATASWSSPPSQPRLLQLPADVLHLVCDQLDAPAAVALSQLQERLRAAARHGRVAARHGGRRAATLPAAARGRRAHGPARLLLPRVQLAAPLRPRLGPALRRLHCGLRDRFAPAGNPFGLSYHHARLVMNEHLFGPGRGLALASICVGHTERRPGVSIHCSTDARVRDGELLLLRTYAFSVADDAVSEFRRRGGPRDFRLCEHTCFFPHSSSSPYRQYIPQLQPPATGDRAFLPCRDAPGSCRLCLMDYVITLAPSAPDAAWHVTIKAYHQLGACRSPDDWKWARFSESNRPHLFLPHRPNRRSSAFAPGAVRRRWLGESGPDVDTVVAGCDGAPTSTSAWLWQDTKRLACPEAS